MIEVTFKDNKVKRITIGKTFLESDEKKGLTREGMPVYVFLFLCGPLWSFVAKIIFLLPARPGQELKDKDIDKWRQQHKTGW